MKVHKLEIMVVDFDEVGADEVASMIVNARYPNHAIAPLCMDLKTVDVGEWHDENLLNNKRTATDEYKRIFNL